MNFQMKIGRIAVWLMPEGMSLFFFFLATRGPSLFSDRDPEMAVSDPKRERGQMKKIRPHCLCKWGVF